MLEGSLNLTAERILLVVNTLPPADLSGVGEQVLQLASGLVRAGHEVSILGRGPGQDAVRLEGGYSVLRGARGPKLLFPVMAVSPFLAALRQVGPTVVQVHESDGALVALACRIAGGLMSPQPRLIALFQVSYVEEFLAVRAIRVSGRVVGRPGVSELIFRWLKVPVQILLGWLTAFLADTVLAPSRVTAAELERDYRVAEVQVVPNAMSVVRPSDTEPSAAGSRLLFVGRLRVRKGVEVLLHALAQLDRSPLDGDPKPLLQIAGDGEHRGRLERLSTSLGLNDRVRFLGRCSQDRVRELMEEATALVVPSLYEGMPLVILEAMQRRLAVVASAVSGIPEVVLDGTTGWLVKLENAEALASALKEVIEDPEEAVRRGREGRARLSSEFSSERVAEVWSRRVGIARVVGPRPVPDIGV